MKPDIGYVDNLLKKTHYLDRILISLLKTSMETYSILVTQNVEQCRTWYMHLVPYYPHLSLHVLLINTNI